MDKLLRNAVASYGGGKDLATVPEKASLKAKRKGKRNHSIERAAVVKDHDFGGQNDKITSQLHKFSTVAYSKVVDAPQPSNIS